MTKICLLYDMLLGAVDTSGSFIRMGHGRPSATSGRALQGPARGRRRSRQQEKAGEKLPYVEAIAKETLRLRAVAPISTLGFELLAAVMKRPRLDDDDAGADAEAATTDALLGRLRALYGNMPEKFLWDTSMLQRLIQPTACYGDDSIEEFAYIGRARAQDLLKKLRDLRLGGSLLIQGAKGSGKSTAVAALVGYMLGKLSKVVYICASRFIRSPVKVVRHALLVATGCDESVARLRTFKQLDTWCSVHRKDQLLFVVDDWDKFENFREEKAMLMDMVSYFHILVKLSSTNSRELRIYAASDMPLPTFDFDGPYSPDELQTWIGHSTLPHARLQALDCLTGGMPRLLRFYEEVKGNAQRYMAMIQEPYTSKLYDKVIGLQTTKAQLASAIEMVTTGVQGIRLKKPVDLTCFYKEGSKFRILSPYLRSRAEHYIMEQQKELQSGLEYGAFQAWAAAVRMDCITVGRNPARTGWNVEGLIIAVMRYQSKMWDGLPFACCKTYQRGGEAALLRILTEEELSQGVLVVPLAFNERAVDVMYLMLETGVLTIKVVQITVAKWKHKRRKRSHKVCQEEILPRWVSEEWSVQHQFIYVMPQRLDQSQLQYVEQDLPSYINACHAAEEDADGGLEDAEDVFPNAQYGTEQYGDNLLAKVTNQPTDFRILRDVHRCLSEFDDYLGTLNEPVPTVRQNVRQCGGQVLENGESRPCLRWSRLGTDEYYCCDAHRAQGVNSNPEPSRDEMGMLQV